MLRLNPPPLDLAMDRTLLILYLKKRFGYASFLEIGCRSDANFSRAPFVDKVGVDPVAGGTVRATSGSARESKVQGASIRAGSTVPPRRASRRDT